MRKWLAVLCVGVLMACGASPTVTPQQVTEKLSALGATNIHDQAFEASVPVPRSFTAHQVFEIASVAPAGGQFFICDTKQNCDAIFAYYDALKGLAGPYTYRSSGGTVVVQLNKGLTPDEAERYHQGIAGL